MSSKKFNAHCRIIDYLDSTDSELAEVIRGLCSDMSLATGRGKPGVTFLIPKDKAYRKKIFDMAYSEDVNEVQKASDMINALIMRDVLKTTSDWSSKKDDIPNSLFPSQHVEIESVTKNEVNFKSKAVATLDTKFKDSSRRKNLAVWELTSGEIPVTTGKNAKLKYTKTGKKTGGYAVADFTTMNDRNKIAVAVENAYLMHELQRREDSSIDARDIYLEYTLSLINFICNVKDLHSLMHEKICPMISFDKIDFYFLIEPHKMNNNYLIECSIIDEWWKTLKTHSFSNEVIIKKVQSMLNEGTGALIYSDRDSVFNAIAEVRDELIERMVGARSRNCVDWIEEVYTGIEKNNSIKSLNNVWPQELATYYASEPGMKFMHDEMRYLTYGKFLELEAQPTFDVGAYHDLINNIAECLHAPGEKERENTHKLLNKNSIKYLISPSNKIDQIKIFLHSTMFMFVPMTEEDATNISQKYSITKPSPENIVVFNIAKELYTQHNRLIENEIAVQPSASSIIEALKSINIESLEPSVRNAIKEKFK